MSCPLCRQRKPRRQCPALGQTICAVCCGTKRLTEIACPSSCVYLVSAREHPAAAVKRQQAQDAAVLLPTIQHLTERQMQLFFLFHSVIARHTPEGLARLQDEDVAEAAAAVAASLETAARGIVYEHTPQTLPAQRLATELRELLAQIRQQGARVYDGEAAAVLRAIEQGAREARRTAPEADGSASYLSLVARLLQVTPQGRADADAGRPASSIIVP